MELPPSDHDPPDVRELADSILAASRYDRPSKSIPDRILEWFGEQFGKVLGSLVGTGAGTLVAWLFVLGVVALIVYLIVRFGRVGRLPRRPVSHSGVMVELTRTSSEWRAEAEALELRGQWRQALRCRHRALIAELVRRGVVADQTGRTALEYVADVDVALPAAAAAFALATDLFEAAWYGAAPTGPAEASRFQALDAEVLAVRVGAR